jgi:hypothetical protein
MGLLVHVLATISLRLVVRTEIAVFAYTFGIEHSLGVTAEMSSLCSTLGMVTVLTHTIGIVGFRAMTTLGDVLPVLLNLLGFWCRFRVVAVVN